MPIFRNKSGVYDGNQAKVSSHEDETNLSYFQNGKALVISDIKKQEEMSVKLKGFISQNTKSPIIIKCE